MKHKIQQVFVLKATMLCVGLVASTVVRADNPLGLLLSETLTYDSNILKNDRDKRSDMVSSTGVKGILQKDYGRQRYNASALGIFQRYKDTKEYDNNGYQLDFGLSSEIGANGLIEFSHSAGRSLQELGSQDTRRYKETVTNQSTSIDARYGLHGQWGLTGTLNADKIEYDINDDEDRQISGARFGVRYSPSDLLFFDVGAKRSRINQPNLPIFFSDGVFTGFREGDKVDRTDFNLLSRWVVTGYSSLDAQLGWTRESHEVDTNRDFSGLTGRAAWRYTPRGKMSYTLVIDRDTNNAGGYTGTFFVPFVNLNVATEQRQKRLTTGLQGTATWAATSKMSATLGLVWRQYEDERYDDFLDRGAKGKATYRSASLGLKYVPNRNWTFNCNLSSYKRGATVLAPLAYSGESVACTAGFLVN